ncbi:MAG: hypothetical protein IKH57_21255 [Clostridia bacterium]|nr:hypothetical protein [Clostridia bacterium]
MTIDQAIHTADELKPNQIERARKIDWLSRLDGRIYKELMCTHERRGPEEVPDTFSGYKQDTDQDTVLLAPAPYDEIYRFYLEMHIDLANQEYDKYNNSAMLYATAWGQLARMWNRDHMPIEAAGANLRF